MGRLIFILGGTRSGKSRFAEEKVREISSAEGSSVCYMATARAEDEEMELRIRKHQARRPSGWRTLEEPLELSKALADLAEGEKVVLIDCLTLWLSNVMFSRQDEQWKNIMEDEVFRKVDELVKTVKEKDISVIAVSSETGMGIVPSSEMARLYRDLLGLVNQKIAKASDEAYLVVAGLPQKLK
jgi:adenosylcobinamide kinase/adenosylcobinamide-phosphate guanylyltransferase